MTRKFKNAVKEALADELITKEEMELLLKLADEESISRIDAELYIRAEIKKMDYKFSKVFRNAVKDAVSDGVLTDDEKSALKELARRENIDENDALLYVEAELKKINKNKNTWSKVSYVTNGLFKEVIIPAAGTLIGLIIAKKFKK
ncbi:hypothetical protein QO206_05625 [Leeuwenhoekiella aequorea]|uniref:hypothetical protein n=1 Tax=Leeuwenhoekiella aequorea TaxID=283736 RepID=UPI00352FCF3D|tara:strand:- start:43190 stop:43627 length:438 start_codon:yes stop_codon:yes gene_type:complete